MNIKALYEIKRQTLLQGFLANPKNFDPGLAYAYENRLAPVLNEQVAREQYECDPFEGAYAVSADFMNEVLDHVDTLWGNEDWDGLAFNNLEDALGGYKKNRMEIARTLEYARIKSLFDDKLYDAVSKMAPVEAKRYRKTFSPDDIEFS